MSEQSNSKIKECPKSYEVFIGNELAIQAIWKVVYPACPAEDDLASFLTNRAYSRGIPLDQLKDKGRDELVKLILLDDSDQKPKKIADRFKTAKEATAAHEKERVLMVVVWAQLKWLYMEDIEGESRLDYLKRCRTEGILKSDGYKELKRLEKAAKEGGAK